MNYKLTSFETFLYLILKALKFFCLSDYLSLFVPSICSSLLFYILVRHRSLSPPLAFNYGGAKFSLAPQNSCRGLATQASLFTSLRTTFLKLAISAYNNYTYLS
jgi:hypothetical protein